MQNARIADAMFVTRARLPGSGDTPTGVVIALAFALVAASIYRFPYLDQSEAFKIGIHGAEALSVLLLMLLIRKRGLAVVLLAIMGAVVALRFALGFLAANIGFEQSLVVSFQESRFGIMLAAAPLAYLLLKEATDGLLKRFVVSYLVILVALDVWLFSIFATENMLMLGLRTDSRFFCSIVTPLVTVAVLVLRQYQSGEIRVVFPLFASAVMLLHSALVTTSRMEILLVAGVLSATVCVRWPGIRWFLYLLVLVALAGLAEVAFNGEKTVAGRDFELAMRLSLSALPFGFGLVIDPAAKLALGLPDDFFFSDYGVLLYILRYGVVGLLVSLMLYLLWLRFAFAMARIKGMVLLTGSMLIYLTFIPLLDYGSLNGGFLVAFMLFAPQVNVSLRRHP